MAAGPAVSPRQIPGGAPQPRVPSPRARALKKCHTSEDSLQPPSQPIRERNLHAPSYLSDLKRPGEKEAVISKAGRDPFTQRSESLSLESPKDTLRERTLPVSFCLLPLPLLAGLL